MRKKTKLLQKSAFLMTALFAVSCSVDNAYDLSKDVDMTVAVGEGLTIPLGSSEKIMLTELLDTLDSDVIKIDENSGFYSIEETGTIDATSFDVDVFTIDVDPLSDTKVYNFDLKKLDVEIPDEIKELFPEYKFAYVLNDAIDENTSTFEIDEDVPVEVIGIDKISFKETVMLTMDITVSLNNDDPSYKKIIDNLHIHTRGVDGNGNFYVEVPDYFVFSDDAIVDENNRLYIEDVVEKSIQSGEKHFLYTIPLASLDFSKMPDGELKVVDGHVGIKEEELKVYGELISDTVYLDIDNLTKIKGVQVEAEFRIDQITVDCVSGRFAPEIDPVETSVEIDLGDDLDNLNFEFTNPQLYVTLDNGTPVNIHGDINIKGYKDGEFIEDAEVNTEVYVYASEVNNYYLSRLGNSLDGYTSVHIPDFNDLIKVVPDKLELHLEPVVDDKVVTSIQLGKKMSVEGSYKLSVPMEFDSFALEYTERIEDILGDDSEEITDYVTDINSITLSLTVDNTVPASFVPTIVAYKKDGVTKLDNVSINVSNEIAAGNGYEDGKLTAPVESVVKVNLKATNGELSDLNVIDIVINGSGAGALNANEYIQIKNISVKIDEAIEVDMN